MVQVESRYERSMPRCQLTEFSLVLCHTGLPNSRNVSEPFAAFDLRQSVSSAFTSSHSRIPSLSSLPLKPTTTSSKTMASVPQPQHPHADFEVLQASGASSSARSTPNNAGIALLGVSLSASPQPPVRSWKQRALECDKIQAVSLLALVFVITFDAGAWAGQQYGEKVSLSGNKIALSALCMDHEAIANTPACKNVLMEGLSAIQKRDSHARQNATVEVLFAPSPPEVPYDETASKSFPFVSLDSMLVHGIIVSVTLLCSVIINTRLKRLLRIIYFLVCLLLVTALHCGDTIVEIGAGAVLVHLLVFLSMMF
ncbi:hypothetical protein P280DRAFT_193148 [Massarina eburnea CBS 473.64]|uniref:Uncharacterized protein n=1 Tax=Massarina eburnea CBS 473.64 TaxID=1395130 RepID=A0A6A6RJX7_9PLEO|nr:hypothetical protein P280DRAFT_193148 [Massarina eburnea CBS 473.64]